jgi:hypothetical protein
MKNRLTQSILLAGATALLIVCVSAAFTLPRGDAIQRIDREATLRAATSSPVATSILRPYINVTRQQYETALARWRSQGIREYSIKLQYIVFNYQLMGTWDLLIQTDGNKEKIVNALRNKETSPLAADFLTVESMFETVKNKLDYKSEAELYWEVSFDPALGYPSYIVWNTQPGVQIADIQGSINVQGFEVLKRLAPGTPSSTTILVP